MGAHLCKLVCGGKGPNHKASSKDIGLADKGTLKAAGGKLAPLVEISSDARLVAEAATTAKECDVVSVTSKTSFTSTVSRRRVRVATNAAKQGVVGGAIGGASGLATGGTVGGAVGIIAAPLTFGMSIPIGAAIGSSIGFGTGVATGGAIGAIRGGLKGYAVEDDDSDDETFAAHGGA
jgi:hypothetical protein